MGWFGRSKKSDWPTAIATLDEFYAIEDDHGTPIVQGTGAFTVNGEYYSTLFTKRYRKLADAQQVEAALNLSPQATVRYNPDDPSDNEIEQLPGAPA